MFGMDFSQVFIWAQGCTYQDFLDLVVILGTIEKTLLKMRLELSAQPGFISADWRRYRVRLCRTLKRLSSWRKDNSYARLSYMRKITV